MKKRNEILLLSSALILCSSLIYHFVFMDHSHDMTPHEKACSHMKTWHPDCKVE